MEVEDVDEALELAAMLAGMNLATLLFCILQESTLILVTTIWQPLYLVS